MRKTNINNYNSGTKSANDNSSNPAKSSAKIFLAFLWKFVSTAIMICFVAGIIVGISMIIYMINLANEPLGIDLHSRKLNLTSYVYVYDENNEPVEYQKLYSSENREWVDFNDIPKAMKNAMVAIEDKRFYTHSGVDWIRTASAVLSLATGSDSYGGSTLTQQLIKNVTQDNEVSITRKLREIFRALSLERKYTKEEILESYLNIVNFGGNLNGVQAAAKVYFNKTISECSIAECAAIAGITQNPSYYNPLYFPDHNKERREIVLKEMLNQEKISEAEYKEALEESSKMKFIDYNYVDEEDEEEDNEEIYIQNWYIDAMIRQLRTDLAEKLNISEDYAEDKLYTEGYKIYCAMDVDMQNYAEDYVLKLSTPYDKELELGYTLMGLDGRMIATVGSRNEKTGAFLYDRANGAALQPGSTIKPIGAYPLAIENGDYIYSSVVQDTPIEKWDYSDGTWKSGPNNWYTGYNGSMYLLDALEWSSNATAAQSLNMVGVQNSYSFVTGKLGFKHLTEQDSQNLAGLSIGGLNGGVTVTEMAAAYQIYGNGGKYYKPYTYYYVTDSEGNTIIDNTDPYPLQAVSAETAYIMNRMLNYNINNSVHTGAGSSRITGWDIIGKTGTTDSDKDSWFCGLSPICVAAIWTGYDNPQRINSTSVAVNSWHDLMAYYLSGRETAEYNEPPTIIEKDFCISTGLLATDSCTNTRKGYYVEGNMPAYCSGHAVYTAPQSDNDSTVDSAVDTSSTESQENASNTQNPDASSEQTGGNGEDTPSESTPSGTESQETVSVPEE